MSDRDEFDPEGVEEREIAARAAQDADELLELVPHYYRGEVSQMTAARGRIGQTTDWAITVLAAILTLTFSDPNMPAYLLLIGVSTMCVFLFFEVRRYREFDRARARVRLVELNVFANAFNPTGAELEGWRAELGADLRRPTFKISRREALSNRVKRVYGPLLTIFGIGWLFKITLFTPERRWQEAAEIPGVPGAAIAALLAALYVSLLVLAFWPAPREAMGEVYGEEAGEWKRNE